jgi:hypothetical protein
MKRSPHLIFAFAASALVCLSINAQTSVIVLPKEIETTYGNAWTYQFADGEHIYAASEFDLAPSDVIIITGLAFRVDEAYTNSRAAIWRIGLEMNVFPGSMKEIIERKTGVTNPIVDVFTGAVTQLPRNGPSLDYDLVMSFDRPFVYDRRIGPLVVQTRTYSVDNHPFTDIDAQSVPAERGVHIYTEGGFDPRRIVRPAMATTQFFFVTKQARINEIRRLSDVIQLAITVIGSPLSTVKIEGATVVDGPYSEEPNVRLRVETDGQVIAEISLPVRSRFFRVALN